MTDEQKEQIIKMNKEGYNTVDIAKKINVNNTTVGRFLKKNNLQTNYKKTKLLNEDKEKICDMYASGLTAKEILESFKNKVKTENTIMSIVKDKGINRPRGTHPTFDKDYFEIIDTEEKAYFLGLILSDGNVYKEKRNTDQYRIQFSLKSEDGYILKKFKEEINSKNMIRYYQNNDRDECIFSISSTKMANDLKKYGIVPRKTYSAKLSNNIPKELYRHYIRGIFDGDGTVFISKNGYLRFGFYGTHDVVEGIQNWMYYNLKMDKLKIFDKENVSFVIYQKPDVVRQFYNLIYKDASIYLKRKKNLFDNYMR